jgi:hypothetical protein
MYSRRRIEKDFIISTKSGPLGMDSCYQTRPDVLSKTRLDNEHHWPQPRTSLLEETIQMRWKKLVNAIITTPVHDKYRPDPKRWVCICPAFARSRFLISKHLVQAVQPVVFPTINNESYATFLGTSNPHPRSTTSDNISTTQIPSKQGPPGGRH